jgi:4-amino-4-deoxy-L-arabinose transferase-like glycosyltransferase
MSSNRLLVKKTFIIHIFLILIISLIPRLLFLDRVPTGISNDELDLTLNSKSFFYSGRGISYSPSPITITQNYPKAELQSIFFSPIVGILNLSLFNARLPYALLGALFALLIYLISKEVFDEKVAFVTAIVTAINPWNIFFSRTAYDAPFTTFFLLLSLYLLLRLKRWNILWILIPLSIAFHGYTGMMIIFIPYVIIICSFGYFVIQKKKYLLQYLLVFSVCILLLIRYLLFLPHLPGGRISEISFPSSLNLAQIVDNERQLSIQNPFIFFYSNKLISYCQIILDKYIGAFSPWLLFLHGDNKFLLTIYQHGLFYLSDIFFIIYGFIMLFQKKRQIWILLCFLILISPIPTAFSNLGVTFASRSYLLQVPLIIFLGYGLSNIFAYHKNVKYFIIVLYILEISNFFIIYILRNPIYNSESFNYSGRVLSRYVKLASSKSNIYILSGEPKTAFKQYIFYSNIYNKQTYQKINILYNSTDIDLQNIHFVKCLPDNIDTKNNTFIKDGNLSCPKDLKIIKTEIPKLISRLSDGGSIYDIYNDKLCKNTILDRFTSNFTFSIYEVEKLTEKDFCHKLISTIVD